MPLTCTALPWDHAPTWVTSPWFHSYNIHGKLMEPSGLWTRWESSSTTFWQASTTSTRLSAPCSRKHSGCTALPWDLAPTWVTSPWFRFYNVVDEESDASGRTVGRVTGEGTIGRNRQDVHPQIVHQLAVVLISVWTELALRSNVLNSQLQPPL